MARKKSKRKRYKNMSAALHDIRQDYLVEGYNVGFLHGIYSEVVDKPFTHGTLKNWIVRSGLSKARKELKARRAVEQHKRAMAPCTGLSNVITENGKAINEKLNHITVEKVLERERKLQDRHTKRMEKESDKAYGVIKDMEPGDPTNPDHKDRINVASFMANLSDFDKLCRKTFNMENSTEPMSAHQYNLAILVNQDKILADQEEHLVVEARLVEEA